MPHALASRRLCRAPALVALGLLVGVCGAAAPGAGSASFVGSAGAPRSFRYVGCKAFSASQLAAELESSLDVQVASIPGAPMDDYLAVVQRAVTSGYLNAGHLAATATVTRDEPTGTVVVTITEGPRYTCGPIRVLGAKTLPVEQLVAKLTAEQPPTLFPLDFNPKDGAFRIRANLAVKDPEPPAWSPRERVRGDASSGEKLREALRRSGCELGYFDLWAEYRFTTDAPVSTLEINIRNEGPRAVLDAVEVTGVRKNLPDRVRDLTGLQLGQPLDLVRLRDVQQRLWDAARFTEHTIYAAPQRGDPSRMRVRIELREYEHAPRLHEPFSPMEQAALNFQRWASGIRGREEELVATMQLPAGRFDAAVGHRRGFVARLRGAGADDAPQFGVFATPSILGLASRSGGPVFRRDTPPMTLHADVTVGPAPEPNDGREISTLLNFGASSKPRPESPPLELRLALAPVAFVQMVHRDDGNFTLRDGVLEGKGEWIKRFAADAATGRLLELKAASEDGRYVGTASVAKGAADEMVASMTGAADNAYDPAAPVASFVRFVATQAVNIRALTGGEAPPRDRRLATAAAEKLLSNEALAPLEPLGTSLAAALDPTGFSVPNPPLSEQRAPFAYTLRPVLKPVDDLFPRTSWPWTLARLGVLIPTGEYRGATEEVGRLMASDDVGPIGYLLAAELLARSNAPMAVPFAKRGLQRLDVEKLDVDLDQLLSERHPPAQVLGGLAKNLRGLTPQEVEALSAELPAEVGARLVELAAALRRQPDAAPQPLLRAAMRDAWSKGWRDVVETRLRALASVEAAPP